MLTDVLLFTLDTGNEGRAKWLGHRKLYNVNGFCLSVLFSFFFLEVRSTHAPAEFLWWTCVPDLQQVLLGFSGANILSPSYCLGGSSA